MLADPLKQGRTSRAKQDRPGQGGHPFEIGHRPVAQLRTVMADPETPAEWLARATEARGIAERMQRALARKTMIEIAAGYERLAGYAGSATRRAKQQEAVI